MVVLTWNPSTQKAKAAELLRFKASLGSRPGYGLRVRPGLSRLLEQI